MDVEQELQHIEEQYQRGSLTGDQYTAQRAALLGQLVPLGTFGAYHLLKELGSNSRGTTWLARHRTPHKAHEQGGEVILKTLDPRLANNAEYRARFVREAELGQRLRSPAIARVLDMIVDGGDAALVMERIEGVSLSSLIHEIVGPIHWRRALTIAISISDAVSYAHEQGVIHRNLKPANIIVTQDDMASVIDFGVAQDVRSRMTVYGSRLGTVDYGAPEQFTDAASADQRADVYGIAMTLYEMLAGRLPWEPTDGLEDVMLAKLQGTIRPPNHFFPAIPPRLSAFVMRCLSMHPEDRPASAGEMKRELVALRDTGMQTNALPQLEPLQPPELLNPSQPSFPDRPADPVPPAPGPGSPDRRGQSQRLLLPSLEVRFSTRCPFCGVHAARYQSLERVTTHGANGDVRVATPICGGCFAVRDRGRSLDLAQKVVMALLLTAGLVAGVTGLATEGEGLVLAGVGLLGASVIVGSAVGVIAGRARRAAGRITLGLSLAQDGTMTLSVPTETTAHELIQLNPGARRL